MPDAPIQPFDAAKAVDAIREKIRGAILEVIPQEQWDAMIKSEMHAFMNDTVERTNQWSEPRTVPARFKIIARELLEEQAKERIKTLLNSPEWTSRWVNGDQEASEMVKQYVTENAGRILENWIGRAIQQVVNSLPYVYVPK